MASVTTPTINKIIRLKNYDLLGTQCKKYNMYMCLDTLQLWYDESDSKRVLYAYVGVDTVNDLQKNLIPELGTTYYCWESNSLWLWMNRWICLYTDGKYPSAYRTDNGYIEEVYLSDDQPTIVDNNGLLRDGSVVVRDANRIIKGRLYISDSMDNLVISSYLGGGVRILPNGAFSSDGELYIDDDAKAYIRGEWNVRNHEIYVDYTEKPNEDKNEYRDSTHRYRVWHEGNLKLSSFDLTGENIYNKIIDAQKNGTLPDPLVLNVDRLNGLHSTDFALKSHVHTTSEISDFKEATEAAAEAVLKNRLTNMISKGAKITWVEASKKFMLSTDNFILTLTGGVTGQGTVTNNTNTTIAVTVDPNKHKHKDITDRLDKLEKGGGADLSNYYNKQEVDKNISDMFSATPIQGKALLVDKNKNLPGNALTASDLDHDTELELDGDITGAVTFGYDLTRLTLTTDASKIVSDTATAGKALKLDSNAELPATSYKAKQLDHDIEFNITGAVTGRATLDTSQSSFTINTTIPAGSKILTKDDLGVTVASLGSDGKVLSSQLPDTAIGGMKIVDTWSGGIAPSTKPGEGNVWYVDTDCTFNGESYKAGDWIYYHNSSWNRADLGVSVKSVNGKSGESITLTPADVKAISEDYIDYTIGADIPQNKIVVTDKDRHIAGATVDNLTKEFSIGSTNGDVSISATKSTNLKTDGSKNLNLTMEITQDGYDNIATKLRRDIKNNNSNVPFRKNLNFVDFAIADDSGTNTVTIKPDYTNVDEILYFNGTLTDDFKKRLTNNYYNKNDRPFYIAYRDANNRIQLVGINGSIADAADNTTISIPTGEYSTTLENSKVVTKTAVANVTFDGTGNVSNFIITRSTATEALPISGGTVTGEISYKTNLDLKLANNGVSSGISYPTMFHLKDKNNYTMVRLEGCIESNGNVGSKWYVDNYAVGGTSYIARKGIGMSLDKSGNLKYYIDDAANFRSAISAVNKSGDTMTGTLSSSKTTSTFLAGNQGQTIINSTAASGSYTMLAKLNSTNGKFTEGVYQGNYLLQYTANSTISAGTNSVTKSVTLLNEAGNSSFPGRVSCAALTVNGRKVFMQSGTPSGAANGDIWIVTK